MNRLAILGASGHGAVVADAALLVGWRSVEFYDDRWPAIPSVGQWPVIGNTAELLRAGTGIDGVIVAIGANIVRLAKQDALRAGGLRVATITHPAAVVSSLADIGIGCVLFAGAVVNAFATVGAAGIINTCATVDHDCVLGDGVHLGPGAHLGGTVRVGRASWIGIGAVVRHGIAIGANVIVGAGAAVVNDVDDDLTVVGVPARPIISRRPI